MQRVILCLIVLLVVLPVSAYADENPAFGISEPAFNYPPLTDSLIPGTFSRPYQTALKDGDQTYLGAFAGTDQVVQQGWLDATAIGAGMVPVHDVGPMIGNRRQLQSDAFIIESHGKSGTFLLPVHLETDAVTSTSTVSIKLDNSPPTISITKFSAALATALQQGDELVLSGVLDGTGTIAHLFSVFVEPFLADGTPTERAEYYYQQESAPLRALANGPFTNLRFPILNSANALVHAALLKITLLAKDEAGNAATTSASFAIASTSEIAASSSADTGAADSPPSAATHSNVLFFPGIEASRLYVSAREDCDPAEETCPERKAWEPSSAASLNDLALDENGRSMRRVYTKENDVIDTAQDLHVPLSKNLYADFFRMLDGLVRDNAIGQWKPIAYDWRISIDDLVRRGTERDGKIFFDEATATPYIEQTLRELAASSATGKVTIIAHSNGGLVAKALLRKLGAEASRLVDKVVLVGVPQSGAAKDVALLLYGYGGALPIDSCAGIPLIGSLCGNLIGRADARAYAEHLPLAYHLLPSSSYFSSVADGRHHIVEFNDTHAFATERAAYKSGINSESELQSFLQAKEGGRTKPLAGDLTRANVLTESGLLAYASSTHASLDSWVAPASMQVYEIAGTGVSTLSGIDYDDYTLLGNAGVRPVYRPIFTLEGDGTVQAQSAEQMKAAANVHTLWLPLGRAALGLFSRFDHSNLFESSVLQDELRSVLEDASSTPAEFSSSRPAASSFADRLLLILHSPLSLVATATNGQRTGIQADGSITEDIPESQYGELGDDKYVTLPSGSYRVELQGTGSGTFTLDVEEMSQDVVTKRTTFAEVPVRPGTRAWLTAAQGAVSTLSVDEDGDGKADISLQPRFGTSVQYEPSKASNGTSSSRSTSSATAVQVQATQTPAVPEGVASGTIGILTQIASKTPTMQNDMSAPVHSVASTRASSSSVIKTKPSAQQLFRFSLPVPVAHAASSSLHAQASAAIEAIPRAAFARVLTILYSILRELLRYFGKS